MVTHVVVEKIKINEILEVTKITYLNKPNNCETSEYVKSNSTIQYGVSTICQTITLWRTYFIYQSDNLLCYEYHCLRLTQGKQNRRLSIFKKVDMRVHLQCCSLYNFTMYINALLTNCLKLTIQFLHWCLMTNTH